MFQYSCNRPAIASAVGRIAAALLFTSITGGVVLVVEREARRTSSPHDPPVERLPKNILRVASGTDAAGVRTG